MKPLLVVTLAFLVLPFAARAESLLKPNDFVAICGDSITKQKRYSTYVEDYLLMCQPVPGLRVEGFGWSAETYGGFITRAENDVLRFKPTIVTICYGMNDGLYKASEPTTIDHFREDCSKAAELFKAHDVRTGVFASPGAIDPYYHKAYPDYNKTLADLRDVVRDVATKEGFAFADLHDLMEKIVADTKKTKGDAYTIISADGKHPGPTGHLVMAYGILKALGCDGAIGTLTVDLAAGKADGSEGQKIVSFKDGTIEVESTRYPFCFQGKSPEFKGITEVLPFLPFNQDLNRYLLIVKGLKGTGAKVTWGTETKTFSTADLEIGVNLADSFPNNPFCDAFANVDAAVHAQQGPETEEMQKTIHPLMKEKDAAKIDQTAKAVDAADRARWQAAAALVVPVRHTLKIEPQP